MILPRITEIANNHLHVSSKGRNEERALAYRAHEGRAEEGGGKTVTQSILPYDTVSNFEYHNPEVLTSTQHTGVSKNLDDSSSKGRPGVINWPLRLRRRH